MTSIGTDFSSKDSVFQLRQRLFAFASDHEPSNCQCVRHPDLTVIDMGEHDAFFSTVATTHERGAPFWWLFVGSCSCCGQDWLVAAEERQNDVYILRRMQPSEREAIAAEKKWPSDFDRYEDLLRIARDAGRSVRFVAPLASSLVETIGDLAEARPRMRITEIASLLNMSTQLATLLARKASDGHVLDIDYDAEEP